MSPEGWNDVDAPVAAMGRPDLKLALLYSECSERFYDLLFLYRDRIAKLVAMILSTKGSMTMIEKVVKKSHLKDPSSIKRDLAYWLSRAPEERMEAVDYLRRQYHGSSIRLQRSVRVIEQTSS